MGNETFYWDGLIDVITRQVESPSDGRFFILMNNFVLVTKIKLFSQCSPVTTNQLSVFGFDFSRNIPSCINMDVLDAAVSQV